MKWTWDKFGIHFTGNTAPMERNPDVILDCLKLTDSSGVDVNFYDSIGRASVTVDASDHRATTEDMRLASRKSGWDVEVYTAASLDQTKQTAVRDFTSVDGISAEFAQVLIDHGYFNFDDLSIIDPDTLSQLGGVDLQLVEAIIAQAELRADQSDT